MKKAKKLLPALPAKLRSGLISVYSKTAPFWLISMLPGRTAPANKRHNFIRRAAREHGAKVFVETGTYLGDTTAALAPYFEKIYTFEISPELVQMARKRFEPMKHISVIEGDSGENLAEVLRGISQKTAFWLDGHYSEGFQHAKKYNLDTPIIKEIKTIFESGIKDLRNVILIDDAFEFDGTRGYPTIEELRDLVHGYDKGYDVYVKYNIVYIIPRSI